MPRSQFRYSVSAFGGIALALAALAGCGTTRSTDTARTATEQLLISDAIDRAVQEIDFDPLANQSVYLDTTALKDVTDRNYLVSTMRQHLLASGCTLRDNREEADFVVEARAGAVGTDRNDLLFGIPATNVPQILPFQGVPAAIPEVPLAKRRDQRGVAKISMFAYHRESGLPVWQSGLAVRESSANDVWVFGAGPFEHGTVPRSREMAVRQQQLQLQQQKKSIAASKRRPVNVSQKALFTPPAKLVEQSHRLPKPAEVAQAVHSVPLPTLAPVVPPRDDPPQPQAESVVSEPSRVYPPRLAIGIHDTQLSTGEPTKTATTERAEVSERDSIPLPQPRYDSL